MSLYECAGWSAPLLFTYGIKQVFSWRGSNKWLVSNKMHYCSLILQHGCTNIWLPDYPIGWGIGTWGRCTPEKFRMFFEMIRFCYSLRDYYLSVSVAYLAFTVSSISRISFFSNIFLFDEFRCCSRMQKWKEERKCKRSVTVMIPSFGQICLGKQCRPRSDCS